MDNGEDTEWKKPVNTAVKATSGYIKGSKGFHAAHGSNLKVLINGVGDCKVNVIDKSLGRNGLSVFRLDKAHTGVNKVHYNHINLNTIVSGLPRDPHIPLPTGGLTVS